MSDPDRAPAKDPDNWGCFVICLAIAIVIAAPAVVKIVEAFR